MSLKEKLEAVMASLQSDMALNENQAGQVRSLVENHMAQRKEIKARHGANKMGRKGEIKPLRKKLRQDIGAVLTPEQKVVFKNNKDKYKTMMRG